MYPAAVKTDGEGVATIELPQQKEKINLVHAYASADKHETPVRIGRTTTRTTSACRRKLPSGSASFGPPPR